jgi:hypothetical protein
MTHLKTKTLFFPLLVELLKSYRLPKSGNTLYLDFKVYFFCLNDDDFFPQMFLKLAFWSIHLVSFLPKKRISGKNSKNFVKD